MEKLSIDRRNFLMYGDEQVLFLRDSLKEALEVFRLGLVLKKNNIVLDSFQEAFENSLEGLELEVKKRGLT